MGGESTEAWRTVMISSSAACSGPSFSSSNGGTGLESAIAAVWDSVQVHGALRSLERKLCRMPSVKQER
jgi:hypothetical protein